MSRPRAAEPVMVTSISVVPEEWFRLRRLALDQRVSVSAIIRDAIHNVLINHDRKDRAGA
jgi:hypothetical protein